MPSILVLCLAAMFYFKVSCFYKKYLWKMPCKKLQFFEVPFHSHQIEKTADKIYLNE